MPGFEGLQGEGVGNHKWKTGALSHSAREEELLPVRSPTGRVTSGMCHGGGGSAYKQMHHFPKGKERGVGQRSSHIRNSALATRHDTNIGIWVERETTSKSTTTYQ